MFTIYQCYASDNLQLSHYTAPESLGDVVWFQSWPCQIFMNVPKIWCNVCKITHLFSRVTIVEIQMFNIGTMNFMQKNQFGLVWTGVIECERPVLGGLVWFPKYLGQSWTSFSPWLPVLGAKNWSKSDL